MVIRAGVRFDGATGGELADFNPSNIIFLTGGQRVDINGLRRTTFIDGSGQVVIFGGLTCSSGVNIFTHDHEIRDTKRSLALAAHQGVILNNVIIYPDVFVAEDSFVFGSLDMRTFVLPKSVTRLRLRYPPYSKVGGTGSQYLAKGRIPLPQNFPPHYLEEMVMNIKKYSQDYGAHLEKYLSIVKNLMQNTLDIDPVDIAALTDADYRFHEIIVKISNNKIFNALYATLRNFLIEGSNRIIKNPKFTYGIAQRHLEIIESIKSKQVTKSLETIQHHIKHYYFRGYINSNNQSNS